MLLQLQSIRPSMNTTRQMFDCSYLCRHYKYIDSALAVLGNLIIHYTKTITACQFIGA